MKKRISSIAMALSIAVMSTGFSTPAQAAEKLIGRSQVLPAPGPVGRSPITSGLAMPSVTIGYSSPGIPCYDFYRGGNPSAISIPFPVFEISSGSSFTITVQLQDFGYTGTPILSLNVFQGGKIIAYGAEVFPGELSPGYVAYKTFGGTLPNTTGLTFILVEVSDSVTGASLVKGGTNFDIE